MMILNRNTEEASLRDEVSRLRKIVEEQIDKLKHTSMGASVLGDFENAKWFKDWAIDLEKKLM